MFETILLAIDESGPSERAIASAAALAKRFHGEVVVLEVPDPTTGLGLDAEVSSEALGGAAPLIDRVVMDLKDDGVNARPELWMVRPDDVAASIAEIAANEAVDLIVMGTRDPFGHRDPLDGGAGATLHDEVFHLTHRPVLAVP